MIDPGAAQPLQPASLSTSGGVWPRPRLGKRATVVGLTYSQAVYGVGVFELWDVGRSIVVPPAWLLAWTVFAVAIALPLMFIRWHGLDALFVVERWQRDVARPRFYVWRPVPPKWEEDAIEEAEEERDATSRHLQTYRSPLASEDNPRGWELDDAALASAGQTVA